MGEQPVLDVEELFHLAISDIRRGDHSGAITKLKTAIVKSPEDARLHYLLAVEHAEIDMPDRAMAGMKTALTLNADLHPARFQLGLLQYVTGDVSTARSTWVALGRLGEDHPMALCARGLLEVQGGSPREGIATLQKAIAAESSNSWLKSDMQKFVAQIEQQLATSAASDGASPAPISVGTSELITRYGLDLKTAPTPKKH